MEIFIGIKKMLRIVGLLKFEHPNAKIEKMVNIFQSFIRFVVTPSFFLSILWFFYFRADTFFEKLFALVHFITFSSMIAEYCILLWKREQILELLTQFESKIRERNFKYKKK